MVLIAFLLMLLHVLPAMAQTCQPNGDVDDSGSITVEDARLAFLHYLAIAELTDCAQSRANVDRPQSTAITPSDALCIFQQFLGIPSCFPAQPAVDSTEIQFLVNTAHPLTIRLLNTSNQPVTERQVLFQLTAGDGELSAEVVLTDADGRATATFTVGATPGLNTVEARVIGLEPIVLSITGVNDARGSVEVLGNTQQAPPGTALNVPLVVRVEDEFGNPVAGVEVTVTVSGGADVVAISSASTQRSLSTFQPAQADGNSTATAITNAAGEANFAVLGTVGTEDITAEVLVLDQMIIVPIVSGGTLLPNPDNISPVVTTPPPQTAAEGEAFSLDIIASDPNDDALIFSADNLPLGLSIDSSTGSITGTLDLTASQGSPYSVTLTVSDGMATISVPFTFMVTTRAPTAPVIQAIGNQTVAEGSTQSITVNATDLNGDTLTLTATGLPPFATFTDNGNGTGTLTLAPGFEAAGIFQDATITVTDSGSPPLAASAIFTITVTNVNRAPAFAPLDNPTVVEGATLALAVRATDPDGNTLVLNASGLPSFATLTRTGNGTGTLTLAPDFDAAGTYPVTVTVTDNGSPPLIASTTVTITVNNRSRPPVVMPIPNQTIDEGATQSVAVTATDPDVGDTLTLTAPGLPPFVTLTRTGNGTGTLTLAPDFDAAGTYPVTVTVTDNGSPPLTASTTVTITVNNRNRPPVLAPIPNQTVNEDETQSVAITATDPDPNTLTLSAPDLPPFATLTRTGNGTGTLRLAPDFDDAGTYSVTLTVTDDGRPPLTASTTVTIMVTDVNRQPVADAGEDVNVSIDGDEVRLDGSDSFDPDQDELTFSWEFIQIPPGSSINRNSLDDPTAAQPSFTPDVAGDYVLELTVSDPEPLSATDQVTVRASIPNALPNARITGPNNVFVNRLVTLDGSTSDDGGDGPDENLTFNWFFSSVPQGSDLTNTDISGADSAMASFTPDTAGAYAVTLEVFDGIDSDQAVFRVNAMAIVPPTANAGADNLDAIVGEAVRLDGSGSTDPDSGPEPLSFDWSFVMRPPGSELTNEDIADTAISGFTPDVAGEYLLRLAVSDGEASDSDQVMVVVRFADVFLTVIIEPPGSGTVTIVSDDEDSSLCPEDCLLGFEPNTNVTLRANPDSGFTFSTWNGGGCRGTAPCTVTMNQDRSVTANFTLSESPGLSSRCQELLVGQTCGTSSISCISLRIPVGATCQGECAESTAASLRAEGIAVLGPSGSLPEGFPPACVGFRPDIGGTAEGAQCLIAFLGPPYRLENLEGGGNCRVDGFPYNVYLE